MFKRLIASGLVFGMAALAPPALAFATCMDRSAMIEVLSQSYTEHLGAFGIQSESQVVEIWSSDKTGSWTILVSRADGVSCIVAFGTGFESRFPERTAPSGHADVS